MELELDRRRIIAAGICTMFATAPTPVPARTNAIQRSGNVADPKTYSAVAMQLTAHSLETLDTEAAARAAMIQHIADIEPQIRSATLFIAQYGGHPVKLAVLPEYLFTSFPGRISIVDFAAKVGFASDGPEYAALGAMAQRLDMYIAGNAYERDENFPDFYFQTSFIIGPSGDVVLRYRRLLSMFAPSPHDVWEKYLDIYGLEGVFPVAKTEIGTLACIASEEILYPEIARALAFRGAEVFLHSSSEAGSPLSTNKDIAKQARAFENMSYVVSANTAGISGTALPLSSAEGNSSITDYRGKVVAKSGDGETFTAFANIDLGALRETRSTPAMTNYLARQSPHLFVAAYADAAKDFHHPNGMMKGGKPAVPERDYFKRTQETVIKRLMKAGIIS